MKITYSIERSIARDEISRYTATVNGRDISIDRFSSWAQCGVRYNETVYQVFVRDLMNERRQFSRLRDAKKFVAELLGA